MSRNFVNLTEFSFPTQAAVYVLELASHRVEVANLCKIGTGLFVGSGATLSTVGPAPFFMAFIVMSFVIWAVMNALAEMTTYMPVQGASAPYYVNHFFEPSLAFAAGDSPFIVP